MSRVSLSDDELRGLSEGEGNRVPIGRALFEPADFSDGSRAAHKLFRAAAARVSAAAGGTPEPLPPEIALAAEAAVRQACRLNPEWAAVLELTGQFRAKAILALAMDPTRVPPHSAEAIAVMLDAVAREIAVAFRAEFQQNVAVEVSAWSEESGDFPLGTARESGLVSLDFDLETGPGRPSSLRLFAEPSFVRELACLVRPPRLAQPATPQPPQPVRCEQSTAHAAVPDRPIRLFAGIGSSVMPASEMLALEAGQVIRLDRLAGELATLSIDGQHLATGEVVVADGYLALRLVEVRRPDDWIDQLTPVSGEGEPLPAAQV